MAGRKDKNTVDYFPHYVNHGKTLYIIESKFGLEGYAAWFKILEMLGKSENHFIDCRNETDWEFMCAKIQLMHATLIDIINLFAKLEAINPILWSNKIIWSENFVKNIEDAYKRRNNKCMEFGDIVDIIGINVNINTINVDRNTQSKVKESKLEYSIDVVQLNEWAKKYFHEKFINDKSLETFHKLLEVDLYSGAEVMAAIEYARGDDFWTKNFLTPVKLRNKNKEGVKYIDVFLAKTLNNGKETRQPNAKGYAASDEQLAAIIAKYYATDSEG
jgi:hypothetical protein